MRAKNTIFLSIVTCLSIYANKSFAQKTIKLSDISKFEFYHHGGGLSSEFKKNEVVCDTGIWKCYQTGLDKFTFKEGEIKDNSRRFIKNVDAGLLSWLIGIINKHDTSIDITLFNIHTDELISDIDTLAQKYPLKPNQKAKLINAVKSKTVVYKALKRALIPFPMDDKDYYNITLTTKTNETIKLEALSFANIYNLPWKYYGVTSYNPDITIIFETIADNNWYLEFEKHSLHQRITKKIYYKYFKNKL